MNTFIEQNCIFTENMPSSIIKSINNIKKGNLNKSRRVGMINKQQLIDNNNNED